MSEGQRRLRARVHGRVQGVWYRASTEREATRLGLTGWVRNMPDGTVMLEAEGTDEQLEALLAWCARGPRLAQVERVDRAWSEATGEFVGFEARYR